MIIDDKEIIAGGRKIVSAVNDLTEVNTSLKKILIDLEKNGFADNLIKGEIEEKKIEIANVIAELNSKTSGIMETVYAYISKLDEQDKHIMILD